MQLVEGSVFLKFVEGDPGVPGDGITMADLEGATQLLLS